MFSPSGPGLKVPLHEGRWPAVCPQQQAGPAVVSLLIRVEFASAELGATDPTELLLDVGTLPWKVFLLQLSGSRWNFRV